jgi:tonB-dependent receptor plug domain protein
MSRFFLFIFSSLLSIAAMAQNLYDALEGLLGIRVEQQCQFCNFSEVRMQGLGAEHTQVLLDGEPIYSGLAGVYGLQQLSTNNVDRMEIRRCARILYSLA